MGISAPDVRSASLPLTPSESEDDFQNKRQLRNDIDDALKKHAAETRPLLPAPDAGGTPPAAGGPRFLIRDITLDTHGFSAMDKRLRALTWSYAGTRMGAADIWQLIREATNLLAKHGYSTSAVEVVPGNLSDGVLRLSIRWGYLRGWLIEGKPPISLADRLMVQQAIPGGVEKVLNIHDIDQALENLNNAGQAVRIDVLPAAEPGYSWLSITRVRHRLPAASLGMDNSGSGTAREGLYRYNGSLTFNNLLGGVDTLSLSGSTHHVDHDSGNADIYAGLNYILPVGYNALSLQGSYSSYRKPVSGYYGDYLTKGDTTTAGGRFERVVWRDQRNKLTFFGGLQYKASNNYIASQFIGINSLPYTTLSVGARFITTLGGGGLYSDLTYTRGSSLFGGHPGATDHNGLPTDVRKVGLNFSWSRQFEESAPGWGISTSLGGQYSPDSLLNDNKFTLGDEYTVRGFKGAPYAADQGVFLNNTLSLPGFSLSRLRLSPFVGVDGGWLRDVSADTTTLLGGAAGINLSLEKITGVLTFGAPLHYDAVPAQGIDRHVFTFSTSVNF